MHWTAACTFQWQHSMAAPFHWQHQASRAALQACAVLLRSPVRSCWGAKVAVLLLNTHIQLLSCRTWQLETAARYSFAHASPTRRPCHHCHLALQISSDVRQAKFFSESQRTTTSQASYHPVLSKGFWPDACPKNFAIQPQTVASVPCPPGHFWSM